MKIVLNGAWREIAPADPADATLEAVLMSLGFGHAVVATALNGQFVPGGARVEVKVRDGDRVEVLAPMQGG